ncbi:Helix-turn-helix, AraC domain-containing protein [Desulfovibrio sp. X2]|uniref:AraC family transcriptional regulator n=1 Tax=Desulfovibrio sp. X2 TaxID=941449 RepID=UPI0003587E1B|nr:AraC family transcriptional regulator [Desulfovibrio sp. X2]EPR44272.1 Helix-turn-helix, AraC domain-containing protein [Desulfovibrio sp. X2]
MRPILDVRFLRDPDLRFLEIALVRKSAHVFPKHCHDHFTISVIEAGGSYCNGPTQEKSFVGPGKIALINPGQVHSCIAPPGMVSSYRVFYADTPWLQALARECCQSEIASPEFARLIVEEPAATRAFQAFSRMLARGPDRVDRLQRESAMVAAFSRLFARHGNFSGRVPHPGREHRSMRQVRDYLASHLAEKVSLEELAQLAGLSRYHLLRVFKRDTGMAPHAFHTQMRIDRAKRLLRRGLPIAEVAFAVGFADQSHFSNKFRQFVGATPGQYALG